jgi:type VI secretion system secreted protein Hcp
MAYEFYVTIDATKQGKLKGDSTRAAHKDKITGLAFEYEVKSPRDLATGQASGKRQHSPITMVSEWGPSTPQLFQACVTNEVLKSVLMEFISTDPSGAEIVSHTIKLTNATVSDLRFYHSEKMAEGAAAGKHSPTGDAHNELHSTSFTFQKIEIESKTGKTMASDDWHK